MTERALTLDFVISALGLFLGRRDFDNLNSACRSVREATSQFTTWEVGPGLIDPVAVAPIGIFFEHPRVSTIISWIRSERMTGRIRFQ